MYCLLRGISAVERSGEVCSIFLTRDPLYQPSLAEQVDRVAGQDRVVRLRVAPQQGDSRADWGGEGGYIGGRVGRERVRLGWPELHYFRTTIRKCIINKLTFSYFVGLPGVLCAEFAGFLAAVDGVSRVLITEGRVYSNLLTTPQLINIRTLCLLLRQLEVWGRGELIGPMLITRCTRNWMKLSSRFRVGS